MRPPEPTPGENPPADSPPARRFSADQELAHLRKIAEESREEGAPRKDIEAKLDDPAFIADLRRGT